MSNLLEEAHGYMALVVARLKTYREESESKLIQEIMLQMEQRLRLDQAHLGVLIGLKSHATVRTRKTRKSPASAKSRKPQRR